MIDRFENIADLHDEFLDILLEYREMYNSDLTFALRSSTSKPFLEKGFWFLKKNKALSTYFVLEHESKHFTHLKLSINNDGELSLSIDLLHDYFNSMYNRFSREVALELNKGVSYWGELSVDIDINEENFKENLLKLLRIVDEFLNSEEFRRYNDFSTIPQREFNNNLNYILQKRQELKEKQKNEFPRGKTLEKVFITDFSIENYYAIKFVQIQNLPKEAPWIFLTGENGAGKSLILQGLAIGLYG
ncbi:MAG: chromosomal replication initiation ATPase DnaA, partial [Saprospiraceae bacterium]